MTIVTFGTIYGLIADDVHDAYAISVDDLGKRLIYIEEGHIVRGSIGNLISSRPGNEIATCSSNGVLAVTYGSDNSWKTEVVFRAFHGSGSSERARINSVTTGDVYPELAGDEILTVDDDGSLRVSYHDGMRWNTETIYRDVNWLYEVDQDDIDDDGQPEIVVVGEEQHLVLLKREGNVWNNTRLANVPFYTEACKIANVDTDHPGKEILFGGGKGVLWMAYRSDDVFSFKELVDLSSPITDITTIDIDPMYPGPEIFTSTRDGKIYLVRKDANGNWLKEIIHNEEEIIYGMESGYLSQDKPVLLFASYKHRMGLIEHDLLYRTHIVHREEWNVLGCAIGDLDPIHPDSEIFSLSQLGRLTMIFRDIPGIRIRFPFESTRVHPGEEISIPVHIMTLGGLTDRYNLSVEGMQTASIVPNIASGSIAASLDLIAPETDGTYIIDIVASGNGIVAASSIVIEVVGGSDQVRFENVILNGTVIKDRQTKFIITSLSEIGLSEPFELIADEVPTGMTLQFSRSICDPCETPDSVIVTISVDTSLFVDTYIVFVTGVTGTNVKRAVALVIEVKQTGIMNFRLEILGSVDRIPEGEERSVDLRLISENGFDEPVEIIIEGLVPGINIELSESIVVPTANVTVKVSGNLTGGPYIANIIAKSDSVTHSIYLRIGFYEPDRGIELIGPDSPVYFRTMKDGSILTEFKLLIIPGSDPTYEIEIKNSALPSGFNISYEPKNIKKLPYALNITVMVWGPKGYGEWTLNMTVLDTVNVEEITLGIVLSDEENGTAGSGNRTWIWLLVICLCLALILISILISLKYRDHLKGKEYSSSPDAPDADKKDRERIKTSELRNGIDRRSHRRHDRQ